MEVDLSFLEARSFIATRRVSRLPRLCKQSSSLSLRFPQRNKQRLLCVSSNPSSLSFLRFRERCEFSHRNGLVVSSATEEHVDNSQINPDSGEKLDTIRILLKRGIVLVAVVCGVLLYGCGKVLASTNMVDVAYGQTKLLSKNAWPKTSQVLTVLREQGLTLAVLLSLSAFFSMAETSITTLWPWKVRELAEKEPENGVFRMLRKDITRFLTSILIGTTVVNIAATALVTQAATAMFGEAGVSAATGLMTVVILLLTEITPKSVAVHNAQEVAKIVYSVKERPQSSSLQRLELGR